MSYQQDVRSTYNSQGYVTDDSLIPDQTILNIEQSIDEIINIFAKDGESRDDVCVRLDKENKNKLYQINQLFPKVPAVRSAETHLEEFATTLFPEYETALTALTTVLIGLPEDERLSYGWHQESTYHTATDELVHFWYPLFEASSSENGALELLEGSHKNGQFDYVEKKEENARKTNQPKNVEELEKKYEIVEAKINTGTVLCFDNDLVHRSGSNTSDRVRFSAVTRMLPVDSLKDNIDQIIESY